MGVGATTRFDGNASKGRDPFQRSLPRGFAVYARHRLDISFRDFLYGLLACLWVSDREKLTVEDGIPCLSVRSGFDLLLETLALPEGSEVLVSAITHPDMVRLIGGRCLVPVPVDLDPETLAPRPALLNAALTERTKVLLVAHLFGGRVDLDPLAAFARRHGLLLVEDCAQDFRGPGDMGHPAADVSMYSFGPIKTTSALGGAVLRVTDPRTLERMHQSEATRPIQKRREYAGKLLKYLVLALFTRPLPFGLLARACAVLGWDLDSLVNGASRSFPPGTARREDALLERLRHRPSAPLLALLARRLRTFDEARLDRRAASGERAMRLLHSSVTLPGRLSVGRTHWLFPVVVDDPDALVSVLGREGFDASRATSSIVATPPPADRPEFAPVEARELMERVVFLPVYPELPDDELRRLAEVVAEFVRRKREVSS